MKKRKKKIVNKDTKTYKAKELKRLRKRCLELWAKVVKQRAGNVCELGKFLRTSCSEGYLNSHHTENYWTNKTLRYAPENGIACCPGHHRFYMDSAHKSFIALHNYMIAERAEDLKYLATHYKDKTEITKEFLEDKICDFMKEKII
jgi:Rad3-related DNA helicase